tara:strand:- start:151 stop:831 length:681 start_codon:yes stop_codon:yes gene_type:complete
MDIVKIPMKVRKPLLFVGGLMSIWRSCQVLQRLKRVPLGLFVGLLLFATTQCGPEPREDLSIANLRAQVGTFPYDSVPLTRLEDRNPNSIYFEERKGPEDFQDQVSIWYFVHASCPYCRSQFERLNQMSQEVSIHQPSPQFLAVNATAHEDAMEALAEQGSLPILQDEEDVDLWGQWQINYRDVVVVDANLKPIARINLTKNSLDDEPVYDALKSLIVDVHETPAP